MEFHYATTTGEAGSLMEEGNRTMSLRCIKAMRTSILSARK